MLETDFIETFVGKPIANIPKERLERIQRWLILAYKKIEWGIKIGRENSGEYPLSQTKLQQMVKNKHLSKSITDVSWGQFFNRLNAAAGEARRRVVRVNPRNTSQICLCGEMVKKTLAVRVHECPSCGLKIDRDTLAAKNILKVGQTLQASSRSLEWFA